MIQESLIKTMASETVFRRGKRYYMEGRVEDFILPAVAIDDRVYSALVRGSDLYHVDIKLTRDGEGIESYECDCPAAQQYLGACKHAVAAMLELVDFLEESSRGAYSYDDILAEIARDSAGLAARHHAPTDSERMFSIFEQSLEGVPRAHMVPHQGAYLVPRLRVDHHYGVTRFLELRFGVDRLYVVKNVADFVAAKERGADWALGKNKTVNLGDIFWADPVSEKLYQFIRDTYHTEQGFLDCRPDLAYYQRVNSYVFEQKAFNLSPGMLDTFLNIMGDSRFELRLDGADTEEVGASLTEPPLRLQLKNNRGAGALTVENDCVVPLDTECRYLYVDGIIYRSGNRATAIAALLQSLNGKMKLKIPRADLQGFFSRILPHLERVADIDIDEKFHQSYQLHPLAAELYIDYAGDGIAVRPILCYGDARFNPVAEDAPPLRDGRTLVRDMAAERDLLARMLNYGFREERDQLVQYDEERSYDFLSEELPALPDYVEVFYTEAFSKKPVRPMPRVTTGVSVSDSDLLEVTFNMKDIDLNELLAILDSYRQKRRYHRLKDRTFVTLGEQQLQAVADLVENIGITPANAGDGKTVELPLSQAMYLDELAREDESLRLERSRRFRAIVRDLRHPEDVEVEVPESLRGVLRDYQVTGYNWLSALASYHLGGILADDMGLGKTLQVITFLLAHQDAAQDPSLVVAPTSLVYNWQDEIERFAPTLKALVIAGGKGEREELLESADTSYDVIITTYNMLKRDISVYEKRHFRYVFLDEAQHIKNPTTQNARAVKKLKTSGYFALTGTPIENTLTELWSIFDFLMPGYLMNHKKFKSRYETPIVREQDERALKDLKRHVMPFILRRMKKDVLTELPDKVERKMTSDMTEEQERVYQAWFIRSQKEFATELAQNGFGESRIKILAILTRLRQIACDPAMFLEGYTGGSGKLDMLEEVVAEAVAGGHRLLVFSQFTTMLGAIAERLKRLGISYFYLDGATPALERIRLVKSFNEGTVPIFLISLKAGGTGLNLTGADMVIHFDPWWNPAVEDQATDRAYRLGQKNNVQVLKFITRGTVEEKIYELQQKKKSLIDQMIQPGENFLSKLTEDEVRELFHM